MVPLTPLTSENYTSTIFFLVFHRWHRWRLKKPEEKYFKRDTDLYTDVAVDTVDIKKLYINHFFSCISLLTPLTSEKTWIEIFQKRYWFSCWCCRWHRWHQKIINQLFFFLYFYFFIISPRPFVSISQVRKVVGALSLS